MPEAPVDEDGCACFRENEIRIARESVGPDLPAAYTAPDQSEAQPYFGSLVSVALYSGHGAGPDWGDSLEHAAG